MDVCFFNPKQMETVFLSLDIFACGSADSSALIKMWDFQFRLIIYYYLLLLLFDHLPKAILFMAFSSNGMFNFSLIDLLLLPHRYDYFYIIKRSNLWRVCTLHMVRKWTFHISSSIISWSFFFITSIVKIYLIRF